MFIGLYCKKNEKNIGLAGVNFRKTRQILKTGNRIRRPLIGCIQIHVELLTYCQAKKEYPSRVLWIMVDNDIINSLE